MNAHNPLCAIPERGRSALRLAVAAFTLIEMIGILAVISILALILLPILIRQMDRAALDKETKLLKAFAEGLRQQIITSRYIPDHTGWDSLIASNLGLSTAQVRTNDRRVARAFLLDPTFVLQRSGESASKPPYTQNAGGSIINPNTPPSLNPRVMILSSIAQPLPVSSGFNAEFNTIWNTEEGRVPAYSAWNNYRDGQDLKIQRIHLGDLFVEMTLNNRDGSGGQYAIDGSASSAVTMTRYFLDSSLLELFDCLSTNGVPAYSEILHRSKAFTFMSCTWQQGEDSVARRLDRPKPMDLQLAANEFLALTNHNPWRDGWPNVNSTNKVLPVNIHDMMTNYMRRYVDWRHDFPNAQSSDQALRDAQTAVKDASLWLIDPNGTPVP